MKNRLTGSEAAMAWSVGFIPVTEYGRAVGESALRVVTDLGHELDVTEYDLGPDRYLATGDVLPSATFDGLQRADAIFVGAPPVGGADIPRGVLERGIVFRLRFGLDLFVNLRGFVGSGPVGPIDIAVVRENTEGAYIGEGGTLRSGTPHAIATQGSINTRFGIERCIRYAFGLARKRKRRIALVHKVKVLEHSGGLWQEVFDAVASDFDDVEPSYADVDTACIHLVQDPSRFDVIITDNLFGDILSDLVGALAGTLDRSGSADLNPDRSGPSLFEPIHGTAAYQRRPPQQANPLGAYAAAAMMLDHLGAHQTAQSLNAAVSAISVPAESDIRDVEISVRRMCQLA
jgi:3-isopropylmalate dehydrogenase